MSASNLAVLIPGNSAFLPSKQSFWSSESRSLKQGIKTGLAGTITYAIYAGWNLPQGYWAVFAALVVTQANVGAAWKAALYRTVGSTCGALAAALLLPMLGTGAVRAGVALFILASFFAYLTALYPSFSAAGFTAALILVFGGLVVWPVQAREGLRNKLASILQGAGALYTVVAGAALQGGEQRRADPST